MAEGGGSGGGGRRGRNNRSWMGVSSPNSLLDVHWLYVGVEEGRERLSKEKRDVFVKGRIQDIRKQFQV